MAAVRVLDSSLFPKSGAVGFLLNVPLMSRLRPSSVDWSALVWRAAFSPRDRHRARLDLQTMAPHQIGMITKRRGITVMTAYKLRCAFT